MTTSETSEGVAFAPDWFARVSSWIEAGHTAEACQQIGAAVSAALNEPAGARPPRWSITALWLQLLEQNEIAHAQWVRELEGALYGMSADDQSGGERFALAQELAAVSGELPTAILVAIARSVREETPAYAEPIILEHALRHMRSAHLVAELLAGKAPRLLKRYELVLHGVGGAPVGPAPRLHHIGGVAVARVYSRRERIAIALGCVALILVPVVYLSTGRELGATRSAEADSSSEAAQPPWLRELCTAQHNAALCTAASRVYAAEDCEKIRGALDDLELAANVLARRGSLDFMTRRIVLSLHEEALVECMPVPGGLSFPRQSPSAGDR